MRLLLLRHGIAAPLGKGIARDEDRPLTALGVRQLRQVAAGLVKLVPRPRAILTSPLLRARQTADILAHAWGRLRPEIMAALATGKERVLLHVLAGFEDDDTVVLVGHEDWMSELTARLLGSKSAASFRYRRTRYTSALLPTWPPSSWWLGVVRGSRVSPPTARCLARYVSASNPPPPNRRFLHDSRTDALAYAGVWNVRVRSRDISSPRIVGVCPRVLAEAQRFHWSV
jgi:phosphohistidine phosphatase